MLGTRRRLRQVRRESTAASNNRDQLKMARMGEEAANLASSIRKVKGLFFK